jgi:transposase, IS30 family
MATMSYKHFTIDERDALQVMIDHGLDKQSIARILCMDLSSIYREIDRNSQYGYYLSAKAEGIAKKRRQQSCPRPKLDNRILIQEIERCFFEQDYSPEQISGVLALHNPGDKSFHVSHETIYKHLYSQKRNLPDLKIHFRHGHKIRRKRLSGKDKRGIIKDRKFIDARPDIVEEKTRCGDWEGDTIEGASKKGYVATFVDRKTKYLVAFPLKYKQAELIVEGAQKAFANIPTMQKMTLTVDNGKEFSRHADLGKAIGMDVYFAHPYHSWERGLNEHTNGLLRQYLPKNRSLDTLTKRELAHIVDRINNRPRKSLGYRTPFEMFYRKSFALRT